MGHKKKQRGRAPERREEKAARNPTQLASMADFWPTHKEAAPPKQPQAETGVKKPPLVKAAGPPLRQQAPIPPTPQTRSPKQIGAASPVARAASPSAPASKSKVEQKYESGPAADAFTNDIAPASARRREQYREIIARRSVKPHRPIDVYLGIDLGTSFSKVVWRIRDNAHPVCFGAERGSLGHYLVPSVVAFDGESFVTGADLIGAPDVEHRIPNFKMCLACVCDSDSSCSPPSCALSNWGLAVSKLPAEGGEAVKIVNALFLGKLISRAKRIILGELESRNVVGQVRWNANLAVPEKYMDRSPVLGGFKRVLRTAWLMADVLDEQDGLSSLDEILDCYESAKALESDGRGLDCHVYPEVGAEVASVTLSRAAKDGFYVFVDIGAGTVDASVFNLYRHKGDHKHNTYAAEVYKSGAAHVETSAGLKLAQASAGWLKGVKENNLDSKVASQRADDLLKPYVAEALDEIGEQVKSQLIGLFKEAYEKYSGECNWEEIQLVLGGGGASLPAYRAAAVKAFSLKNRRAVGSNITEIDLDLPGDFRPGGLARNTFHRFAVAYGLSFPYIELPELTLASEVKALPADAAARRRIIVDPTDDG